MFRGASGGNSDPVVQSQELTGAARKHRVDDRASSAPDVFLGEVAQDQPFHPDLDGHRATFGRFRANVAATSDNSLGANLAHFMGNILGFQPLPPDRDGTTTMVDGSPATARDAQSQLAGLVSAFHRADALPPDLVYSGEAENVMVMPASSAPARQMTGNLLTGEWEVPQMAMLGVGSLVAASLAVKVM